MNKIEIIILDAKSYTIKDYTFSIDYTIIFDSLVKSASTFNIGAVDINASSNDIIITRGATKQFIGVINTITENNEIKTITAYYFNTRLDVMVRQKNQENIILGNFIKQITEQELLYSDDSLQNIDYLEVENTSKINGSITLSTNTNEEYTNTSILSIISSVLKGYEMIIDYLPTYYPDGTLKGVKMLIKDIDTSIPLKENESFVTNCTIVDGKLGAVNKLIYYPNDNNVLYKDKYIYYLLNDGTTDINSANEKRIVPVITEFISYQDKDIYSNVWNSLEGIAKEKFASTIYNHYINFNLNENNIIPIDELSLGTRLIFYAKNGTKYTTIITKLQYNSSSNDVIVTLGLNRQSLTDKLALKLSS